MSDNIFGEVKKGMRTPWGTADCVRQLAPGIWNVSTPSHGGIKLSKERLAKMPKSMRKAWYEEDCDWALVYAVFGDDILAHCTPETFEMERRNLGRVKSTIEHWNPQIAKEFYV